MTVTDNLLAGAYLQKEKKKIQQDLDKVYTLFPVLWSGPIKSPGLFPRRQQMPPSAGP
jgi:ABC-type branched-subunit amino acid transport system ATPase component